MSADETEKAVNDLQTKLNNLRKKLLKNQHDAKEIQSQSDSVKDSAADTHKSAEKVELFQICHIWHNLIFLISLLAERPVQESQRNAHHKSSIV